MVIALEAFAAGIAASVGGWALAHIHGGDRAEGIADESMRHALTKMAHLHLAATPTSAERIIKMGESPTRTHRGLARHRCTRLNPTHRRRRVRSTGFAHSHLPHAPIRHTSEAEEAAAAAVLEGLSGRRVWPAPKLRPRPRRHPPRRSKPLVCVRNLTCPASSLSDCSELAAERGVMIGNSSPHSSKPRHSSSRRSTSAHGRNTTSTAGNVVHVDREYADDIATAVLLTASGFSLDRLEHPDGAGTAGSAIASLLASINPSEPGFRRKRCTY